MPAMNDNIICIAFKSTVGVVFLKPCIEEPFYVEVNCPIKFHAIDTALFHCLMCAFAGSIPKRICTKLLVNNGFKFFFNDRLGYPVPHGRYAQCPFAPIIFGDKFLANWHGVIASACHPHKYRIQVFAWIALDVGDFDTVHTSASTIASYCLKGFPYLSPLNWLRPLFLT